MRSFTALLSALTAIGGASAAQYVITVGGNTTSNATLVFQPQEVRAVLGDFVVFNFTQGNHTATQSTFAEPCVWAPYANSSINGFDSSFRLEGNGSWSILNISIDETNANTSIWFFDYNTCAQGGVGAINPNDSSTESLLGFERNAIRLNGTNHTSTSSGAVPSSTSPSSSSASASATASKSAGERNVVLGGLSAIPIALAALALNL